MAVSDFGRVLRGAALVAKELLHESLQSSRLSRSFAPFQFCPKTPKASSACESSSPDDDLPPEEAKPAAKSRIPHRPSAPLRPKLMQGAKEKRVPTSSIERAIGFGGMAASMAFGVVSEAAKRVFTSGNDSSSSKSSIMSEKNFERLTAGLCRMRGAALKLGQMLSLQDESMLAPEVQAVLARVRAGADIMPRKQLEKVLTEDLGEDWESRMKSFDFVPVAAASIGQVHHAVLKDKSSVAMKIQYPGVAQSIRSDLQSVKRLLQLTNVFPKGLYIEQVIEVAHDELTRECDYELEASSQERFRNLVSDEEMLYVPRVLREFSTRRILCSEFVDGVPLSELVNFSQDERNDVAKRLLKLCLRELFEFRFMQTDPNWANFVYNARTRMLYLVDFGATREFDKKFVDEYLRMVVACAEGDRESIVSLSKSMGFLTGSESDEMLHAHISSALVVGEPFATNDPYNFAESNMTRRLQGLASTMLQQRLTPPPVEAYTLHRKLSGLYLACIKLKATIPCKASLQEILRTYSFDS